MAQQKKRHNKGRRDGRARRPGDKRAPAPAIRSATHPVAAWLPAAILVIAGIAVYANAIGAPFIFDDQIHIIQRTDQIDSLSPAEVLSNTFRPVVQYTLAINYAIGGLEPAGYRVLNIAIHILAALALFGVTRRTALKVLGDDAARACVLLALAVSLLWIVHPLQTQSVTYIIQRGESLASLFYLLTLYCAVRSIDSEQRRAWWWAGAIAACGLGMGSKAIVMTAPIAVLVWDIVFTKPPLRDTIVKRLPLYGGLAATWLVMAFTGLLQGVLRTEAPAAGIGFAVKTVTPIEYLFSQPAVLLHYLRLSFWPHPLVIDYEWEKVASLSAGVLPGIVIVALLVATVWGVMKRHWAGFVGAMFFLVLAPTSSFVPLKDLAFEHRMYLPLASVLVVTIALIWWTGKRVMAHGGAARVAGVAVVLVAAGLLGARTVTRNQVYHDPILMWESVLHHRPGNSRAHINIGIAYKALADVIASQGDADRAQQAYARAIEYLEIAHNAQPDHALASLNLGAAYFQSGLHQRGADVLAPLVERRPDLAEAWYNLGQCYRHLNRAAESLEAYRRAFTLRPDMTVAGVMYGNALVNANRVQESVAAYRDAIANAPSRVAPRELAMAHVNLGNSYLRLQQPGDALNVYLRAQQIDPNYPNIQQRIAQARQATGGGP